MSNRLTSKEFEKRLNRPDFVYAYEILELKTVYVGRTVNPFLRHRQHYTNKYKTPNGKIKENSSAIYNFVKEHNIEFPEMKILYSDITVREGQILEAVAIEEYKEKGWNILNTGPVGEGVGSLGSLMWGKWDKETITEAAKGLTRAEFRKKYHYPFIIARDNGWLDEIPFEVKLGYYETGDIKKKVFDEAVNYRSISDFANHNSVAHKIAKENGWLEEMDFFNRPRGYRDKPWTFEEILEIVDNLKVRNKSNFLRHHPIAYKVAIENGWYDKLNIESRYKEMGYWTKERVFETAKKYTTKLDFRNEEPSCYATANKNGWLEEMDWLESSQNYKWFFCSVYKVAKLCSSRGEFREKYNSAYNVALKNGWIEHYSWFAPVPEKWTYDRIYEIAKEMKSRTQFQSTYPGAYEAAVRNNWLEEFVWLRSKNIGAKKLFFCTVYKAAKECTTKNEFREKYVSEFSAAQKNGWLQHFGWLKSTGYKWHFCKCWQEAKKFTSRSEFQKNSPAAYEAVVNKGWLNHYSWLQSKNPRKHCFCSVYKTAKLYKTRGDFRKFAPVEYNVARKKGWLEHYTWLEVKCAPKWFFCSCWKEAKKYTTLKDYRKLSNPSYLVAQQNGWLKFYTWLKKERNRKSKAEYEAMKLSQTSAQTSSQTLTDAPESPNALF